MKLYASTPHSPVMCISLLLWMTWDTVGIASGLVVWNSKAHDQFHSHLTKAVLVSPQTHGRFTESSAVLRATSTLSLHNCKQALTQFWSVAFVATSIKTLNIFKRNHAGHQSWNGTIILSNNFPKTSSWCMNHPKSSLNCFFNCPPLHCVRAVIPFSLT